LLVFVVVLAAAALLLFVLGCSLLHIILWCICIWNFCSFQLTVTNLHNLMFDTIHWSTLSFCDSCRMI